MRLSAPSFLPADELKYDLHVLLVRHGKQCPACAKAGSAKQRGTTAAKSRGGIDCPLADLKVPPSKLKAMAPAGAKQKQRSSKQGGKAADAAAAGAAADDAGPSNKSAAGKRRKVQPKVID